jgi:hypothetical protein
LKVVQIYLPGAATAPPQTRERWPVEGVGTNINRIVASLKAVRATCMCRWAQDPAWGKSNRNP